MLYCNLAFSITTNVSIAIDILTNAVDILAIVLLAVAGIVAMRLPVISGLKELRSLLLGAFFMLALNRCLHIYSREKQFSDMLDLAQDLTVLGSAIFLLTTLVVMFFLQRSLRGSAVSHLDTENKYQDLFENANDAIFLVDNEFRYIDVNSKATELFGYEKDEFLNMTIFDVIPSDQQPRSGEELVKLQSERRYEKFQGKMRTRDGRWLDIEVSSSAILHDGKVVGSRDIVRDISDRKKLEEMLRAISITDELTGLFNRRGFLDISNRQCRFLDRVDGSLFLLFADIDNMKWINDTLGHHMGDQALVEVADLLKSTFRKADVVGRLGGDEFAVLLTEKSDVTSIDSATSRLENALREANEQHDRAFPIALSYGVVRYDSETPCSVDVLLSSADRLMYENKNKKKGKRRPQ